jgi:putative ABC transport system permease protein
VSIRSRSLLALRDASRQLHRDPWYAGLLVLTIGIGVAAATAIFTVARGVVLRPLPYERPEALVALQEYQSALRRPQATIAAANLPRYRAARSFEGVTAFSYTELVLSDGDAATRVIGAALDAELGRVMGVRAALGRMIASGDDGSATARVVVLSDALWRRRYGADPDVVGRSIRIDGDAYTVAGVMPPSFEFPRNPAMDRDVELWVPRQPPSPMMERRGVRNLYAIARLRPGATLAGARAELDALARVASTENPRLNEGWSVRALGLRDTIVGRVRPTIIVLAACVGVLLLIAWANASAATLARLTVRQPALEVRLALGAARARLLELLVAEAVLASIVAAGIAIPAGAALRALLVRLAPVAIPRQQGIAIDGAAVAFALALSLATALIITLAPAWWLRRLDVSRVISATERTVAGSLGRARAVATFIVIQLALGTTLLSATTRLYATYTRLNRIDPGFVADNVTTATIVLPGMRYRDPRARTALTSQLLDEVRAMRGVERAAVTSLLPMAGGLMSSEFRVDGVETDSTNTAALRSVSGEFFQTVGIPIASGRGIAATDEEGAAPVVVVNEALVRESLGGRPAIGATIRVIAPGADSARTFQIVGVARDAKEKDLISPASPIIYFSDRQASVPRAVLVIRSRGAATMQGVRAALRRLDPSLALDDVNTLSSRVRSTYALQLFLLAVLTVFAVSGAALIAVGVYGSVSYAVTTELRSIGVRIALGATPRRVLATLVGRVAGLAALGAAMGMVVSAVASRSLGVETAMGDRGVLAPVAGAVAVFLLALAATAAPAWRASTTDPLIVLRES